MKIQFTGIICEITHAEDFDAITITDGKRKSKIKVLSGPFSDDLLSQPVDITVETQRTLFDNVTGEINKDVVKAVQDHLTDEVIKAGEELMRGE
jgi:hypothetical protein